MDQTLIAGLVVVIIALCQLVKSFSFIQRRYIPLVAILLAVVSSFALGGVHWTDLAAGVFVGLASVGLYSGFNSVVLKK